MNLCRPDNTKSCAACCGLYNAPMATKEALHEQIVFRTSLFRTVDRSPDAIQAFERAILDREGDERVDEDIHVCRFVGFLDPQCRNVGCLLHPGTPGNDGKDLRGLCYYGSLACKTFFCDAWQWIPQRYQETLAILIDDWHLWGLVATDIDFVLSLFGALELAIGLPIDSALLREGPPRAILTSMLRWKDEWPFADGSAQRLSRYYEPLGKDLANSTVDQKIQVMIRCLDFTFGIKTNLGDAAGTIHSAIHQFAMSYRRLLDDR